MSMPPCAQASDQLCLLHGRYGSTKHLRAYSAGMSCQRCQIILASLYFAHAIVRDNLSQLSSLVQTGLLS